MCDGCNTSSSTTAANPDAQAAYTDVVGKAQAVAATPYQPFGGELVAGLNQGQTNAVSQLAGTYGAAQPYIRQGSADMSQAAANLGNVGQYLQAGSEATANVSPYMAAAANQYAQGNTLTLMGSAANQGVKQYQDLAQGAYGKADGYFGQAAGLATPQDFSGSDGVSKYMSPYQQSVIDATMAWAKQNNAAQTSSLVGNAIGNGAYGGDRNGIAVATLAGQQDMADQSTVAGLNAANYAQATNEFNAVQGQRQAGAGIYSNLGQGELQAGSGYAGLGQLQGQVAGQYGSLAANSNAVGAGYLSAGQLGLGTAAQYGQLGTLQGTTGQAYGTLGGQVGALGAANQSSLISGASAGLQGATLAQQNAQQQDTAAYNQYMAGLSYPYQNVGFLSNIVQGIGSQEGNTQTTQGNALSSIAGLGTSSIGILGATGAFGANGYLSGAGGLLSGSDERIKENIAPVGKTFDGQTLHRYNYKGENPARPQIGLIAQEVAQHDPGAVGDIGGGILGVNYDRATSDSAKMGLGGVGKFAAVQGADLAARMAKADGGPVFGQPGLGSALMQPGMAPGLGAPAPMMHPGLAARPHFLDGGPVDPNAPVPTGGLNVSPAALLAGGGLNTGAGLGAGRPIQATQPQADSASPGLGALTSNPGATSGAGLGSPVSFSGPGQPGTSGVTFSGDDKSDVSSPPPGGGGFSGLGGLSQNAWMGVLAAGLGMMGGHSASATSNIGAGGLAGLQTYLGLQQQDKGNAVQQQKLALEKQGQDNTAAYQQGSLGLDSKKVDLSTKQLEAEIANQQRQAGIQSATLANNTANTASEVAARNQATAEGRYSRSYIPGVGFMVQDLTNPTAPPQIVPMGGAASPSAGLPQPASSPAPAAAPPPQGGGPASGPAPASSGLNRTIPGSYAPVPALAAAQPSATPTQGGAPAAPAPAPTGLGAGWKPTTAVPQGYVPPNQVGIYNNPGQLKGEQENAKTTIEGVRGEAQAAGNLQMRLDEMDRQFAQLPKTGLLAPGQGAEARATIAKTANQYAVGLGINPIFDPNAVAANENLLKDRFRLGADLAKSMGGREPGYIVQQAVKANPGADNTPAAYQRITAGLRQAAQYQQDRAAFFDDYNGKFGHLNGAQQAFDQVNPPQAYANRAVVSTLDPRAVGYLQQNPKLAAAFDQKYGPGSAAAVFGR